MDTPVFVQQLNDALSFTHLKSTENANSRHDAELYGLQLALDQLSQKNAKLEADNRRLTDLAQSNIKRLREEIKQLKRQNELLVNELSCNIERVLRNNGVNSEYITYLLSLVSLSKGRVNAHSKRITPESFSKEQWRDTLVYFKGCCAVCGTKPRIGTLQKDHWIAVTDPRLDNPGTVAWNIVPLCATCNRDKGNKNAKEWLNRVLLPEQVETVLTRIEAYFTEMRNLYGL